MQRKKRERNTLKIFCSIFLSILFIDTRSFSSVHEMWNFPRRHIGAAFLGNINIQRKGKGEGSGGVQQEGGVGTDDHYQGMAPDDKMSPRLPFFPTSSARQPPLLSHDASVCFGGDTPRVVVPRWEATDSHLHKHSCCHRSCRLSTSALFYTPQPRF